MIYLPEPQKKDIGLLFVLDKLNICTPFGMELLSKLKPFMPAEKESLNDELDNVGRIKDIYHEHHSELVKVFHIMSLFKDIRPAINKCRKDSGYVLSEVELFELKNFLLSLKELDEAVCGLQDVMDLSCTLPRQMPEALKLLDPEGNGLRTFYISDSASPILKELRMKKRRLEAAITAENDDKLKQKLREERMLVVCDEEEEELLIRHGLTMELLAFAEDFYINASSIGRLDLLLQKGKIAAENTTSRPKLSESTIAFEDVYNPYIVHLLHKRGKRFTPVSITLHKGTTVLTGANMGGKSVALKTLTLNIMLFQMGFYTFAEKAELPLFDFVHLVCEDLQSVDKGLSSFAAEIIKLQQISNDLGRGFSFVALDEFARGTNPSEGARLAKAVARYLNNKNAVSILTTHYDNISSPEFTNYQVIGLKNLDPDLLRQKILLAGAAKSFALIAENMDYRLQEATGDTDPPRDALNICQFLNLSDDILKYVKD